jgi:hypothetical protein
MLKVKEDILERDFPLVLEDLRVEQLVAEIEAKVLERLDLDSDKIDAVKLAQAKKQPRWQAFRSAFRKKVFLKVGNAGHNEYYWIGDNGKATKQTTTSLKIKLDKLAEDVGFSRNYVRTSYIQWEAVFVDAAEYKPKEDVLYFDNSAGVHMLNTWVASPIKPRNLNKQRPKILDDMLEPFVPNGNDRDFFIAWLAKIVCEPWERLTVAVVLRTEQHGLGKDVFLSHCIAPLLNKANYRKAKYDTLKARFNKDIFRSNLLHISEVKDMKEGSYNYLKDIITDEKRRLEDKGENVGDETEIFSNIIFTSNYRVPLRVSENDRRFYFMEMPKEYTAIELRNFDRFWADTIAELKAGKHLQDIRDYFQWVFENTCEEHSAGFWRAIPNDAKAEVISEDDREESADALEQWIDGKKDNWVFQIKHIRQQNVGKYMSEAEVKAVLEKMKFSKVRRYSSAHTNPIHVWQHPDNKDKRVQLWTDELRNVF